MLKTRQFFEPMRLLCRHCLLALAVVLWPALALAQGFGIADGYEVEIIGLEDREDLLEAMRGVSLSVRLNDEMPATIRSLERRVEGDVDRFQEVLRSEGFYDGIVVYDLPELPVNGEGDAATPTPDPTPNPTPVVPDPDAPVQATEQAPQPVITFTVDTGPVYVLADLLVKSPGTDQAAPIEDELLETFDAEIGMMATAARVLAIESALIRYYQTRGYPFAEVAGHRAVINSDMKTMTVTYDLSTGEPAQFGPLRISGLEEVDEIVVRRAVPWEEGWQYDVRLVEEAQRNLAITGLFSTASLRPQAPEDTDGGVPAVPMLAEVAESKHRSIGGSLTFQTDIGPGANAFWEHRNFFGLGDTVRFDALASSIEQGVEGEYRRPWFPDDKTTLVLEGDLKQLTTDAFDEVRISTFAGVERRLSDKSSLTLGPTFEAAYQDETETEDGALFLLGLRGIARRDSTDDLLHPTEGVRVELAISPYHDFGVTGASFTSTELIASTYLSIDDASRFIFAGRGRIGAIIGAERNQVPASKRFYAGGGGSIRGYGFQSIGPLDSANDPLGGLSAVEAGLEFRAQITDTIGIVPFIEGGNVYEDEMPFSGDSGAQDLFFGAGIGLRYFTGFGPVRADIAFPLDRRSDVDDAFQFYISFGQAF